MVSGKRTAILALGIGASFAVAGCFSFPRAKAPPPHLLDVPAGPQAAANPGPDLRIPANQVAQGNDIPVVPLPPIPRASSQPLRPPVGPVVQVGAPVPAAAPGPADTTPPPAPPLPPQPAASTFTPPAPLPVVTTAANPTAAATEAVPTTEKADRVKRLQQQAAQAYAGMDSYIARLTRREVVAGKPKPEEIMLFKFRKEPWSVYFKWLGDEGHGREVVYVKGQYGDKINTLLAKDDMPALLMPADRRMALAVDSSLVRSASRHSITEAGLGSSVAHLGRIIDGMERGDKKLGTIVDLGMQQRPEYPRPLPMIEHTLPPGLEPELPRGGKRQYGFDPESHLPVLVITRDDRGQEVEYYRYDRIQFPVKLDADDFDPDKLWKAPVTRSAAPK